MIKKSKKPPKERMIHIRLDEKTHRRLKIDAVRNDTSIQQLIEDLILNNLMKTRSKDIRS